MKTNFIVLLAVFFIIEIYVYQAIRNITTNNYIRIGYWVFTLLTYGIILYWILTFNRASRDHQQIQLMVSAMMIFVLPKLLSLIFLLIGDFARFIEFGFKYFTANETISLSAENLFLPQLLLLLEFSLYWQLMALFSENTDTK